jgi:hypothetical protein
LCALLITALAWPLFPAQIFPDYPVRPANSYMVKAEKGGVVVGVEPVEDLKEQKTYFNTELTSRGVLPVFVTIENGGTTDSFLFNQSNVGYAGVSNNSTPNLGLNKVEENIVKTKLKSATLSPGTSVHGFLYIPVPKKAARQQIHLQVPITKAGTSETFVLNLIF